MENPTPTDSEPVDPNRWVDEYGDYLFGFALSRLRDRDTAEEAVQETFVAALKNVHQFSGKGSERAWLLGVLKRKIIDHYRSRKRDPHNLDDETGSISEMLFDEKGSWRKEIRAAIRHSFDSLDRQEFWQIFRRCLGLLPKRQADIFTLRVMDERESKEICKELDISSTNYWVILHRARLQLASCMKQRWFQENH